LLALTFDGSSGRVFIPDYPLLELTNGLTIEAFINAAAPGGGTFGQGQILFRGDDRGAWDPYEILLSGTNLLFEITDTNNLISSVQAPISLHLWHHVAGTLDNATGAQSLYIDGVLVAQTNTTERPFGPLIGANPGLGIGNVESSSVNPQDVQYFNGLIDEVRISDTALTTNQFLNARPILSAISNTNILETVLWQYTPTVSGSGYTYGSSNAPTGLSVDSSSGTISWTPTETQGPSTNGPITYAVYQSGSPLAWTNFTVVVLESNLPPVFTNFPGTQTVYATTTLNVTIAATDPDIPANTLTFAIVSAPFGVAVNPSTGVLTWTPTTGQVGTNTIYVSVTDYNPWAVNSQQLSVTNSFQVQVLGLTAPTFTLSPSNVVASLGQGFGFVSLATGFPTPTYQWQFSSNGVTYVNLNGATGANYSQATSGVTNIGYYRVLASNFVNTNTSIGVSLTFLNINMYAGLNIVGPLGANYNVQSIPALNGSNWTTLTNISLPSQPYIYIDYNSPTNAVQFYRAVPQ